MLNVPARAPSLRAWAVNARTGTAARLIWSRTWVGVPPQPLATQVRPGRTKPPLDQVEALRAEVFFALAAELMKVHPPHLTDFSALARTTRIGLRPGECFDPGQLDAKTLAALDTVPKAAQDHFAAGELPPADAFWSITMYDEHGFQAANPINRFVIGDRDRLAYNNDGLAGHLHPAHLARRRQGGELATRSSGPARHHDASVCASVRSAGWSVS